MKSTVKWLNEYHYGATTYALNNADLIMANKFIFNHPYDMEPNNEIIEFREIDWLYTPNEDEEWTFMLNRQEYLLDLLIAFQLTDKQCYLIKAKELMLDWVDKCIHKPACAWRTIDTGIRLMYWTLTLKELKRTSKVIEEEELSKLEKSIMVQISYLYENYITKYDLSNWGVLITSGIIVTGNLNPNLVSTSIFQKSLGRLCTQLQLQIQETGLHWEQSPLYFMEVWRHIVMVWLSFGYGKQTCPESIKITIQQMLKASIHFVKPNSYIIQQGDTDSIRITDMIQTTSLLLNQKLPRCFSEKLEIDLLLFQLIDLSKIDIRVWPKKLVERNEMLPMTLIDHQTGNYFFRDSWNHKASFFHIFNGPLGSGHGHASLGHIDFAYKGTDVLIDSGRYTYRETNERLFLKSVQAHNVLTINENPFCLPRDSWGYQKATTPLANQVIQGANSFVTQINYNDQQGTAVNRVTRTFLWLKEEELLVIFDYCQGEVLKIVEQRLTFNPDLTVTNTVNGLLVTGGGLSNELGIWSNYQEGRIESTLYSPIYNELYETTQFIATQHIALGAFVGCTVLGTNDCVVTTLVVRQSGSDSPVSDDRCFAIELQVGGQQYIVAIQSEDTFSGHKLYFVKDHPIYGKLVLVKNGNYERLL